jgi:hypothetical protein
MTKKINIKEGEELTGGTLYTQRYQPNDSPMGNIDFPQFADFPYIEDPKAFTTHRALENWIREQMPGEQPPAGAPGGDPSMAGAPGGDPSMQDPSMMGGGMPGMPPEMTSSQIGRVFELKKIYSRLTAIESFLSRSINQSMLTLRKYVSQAIDLFEIVISNMPQYQDKLDDIIVTFYKFLQYVYELIRKYFSEEH